MDPGDLLGILCIFGCVMAFITVVGHGIWVVLAFIFRQISGDVPPGAAAKPCPYCHHPKGVIAGRCMACGRIPQVNPGAALEQDLEATARHLRRLHDRKVVSPEQFEQMMAVINSDLARLRGGPSPVAQPAAPPLKRPQGDSGSASPPPVIAEIVDAEVAPGINWVEPAKPASQPTIAKPPQVAPFQPAPPRPAAKPALPVAPAKPVKPAEPARPLADMLQSFMEESNIRWGEIIAGLLIVVSAVGLIISLRNTLKAIPYSSAILFMLFTVSFFGAGMYTLRRWKLHAISRVILIISLLLVPLSFSAAIVMSGSGDMQRSVTDPLFIIAMVIGTVVYSLVTFTASRELVGEGKWRLTVALMGASLSQVVINRIAPGAETLLHVSLLAAFPVASFLVASAGQVLRGRAWRRFSAVRAQVTFLVLGLAAFSFAAPLSLLLHHSADRLVTLARLTPALSIAAAGMLAIGLLVHRRALASTLAAYRTAGTAIALGGGLAMLAMVAIAWPEPDLLLAVGLVNFVLLAVLAVAGELSLLHGAAIACGALAVLVGYHLAAGRIGADSTSIDLIKAAFMGRSGVLLGALAVAAGGGGVAFFQWKRREDGLAYLGGAAGLCGASLLVALVSAVAPLGIFGDVQLDSDLAAPLLLVYAAICFAAAFFIRVPSPAQAAPALAGSALLWLGLAQALELNETLRSWLSSLNLLPTHPVIVATLAHAVINVVIAALAAPRLLFASAAEYREGDRLPLWDAVLAPLTLCGAGMLLACTPFILWPHQEQLLHYAAYAGVAAAAWLGVLLLRRLPAAMYGVQSMLALGAGYIAANVMYHQLDGELWYLKVPHLQLQMLLVAIGGILFAILRRVTSRQKATKYEPFTDRARKVMVLVTQEARRFNHEYIGTEHILLGLVQEGSGVAAHVLKNLDVDLLTIRLEVEKLIQFGSETVALSTLLQTPRARNVIEYSMEEARNLKHDYVGTEHILLGLLREQEGVAAQILMNLGLELKVVRDEVLKLRGPVPEWKGEGEARGSRGREEVSVIHSLLVNPFPAVDQLLLTAAVRMVAGLAVFAAWHGVWFELGVFQAPPVGPLTSQMPLAGGAEAWIVMVVVFLVLVVSLWERVTLPALMGIAVTFFAIPWLVATWWADEHAVASAARWMTALYGLCGASVFIFRSQLLGVAQGIPGLTWGKLRRTAYYCTAWQPLVFAGLSILTITIAAVSQQVNGVKLGGPLAGSLFDQLGPTVSYAVPLYALVAILLGYCIRERQPLFALGGSAVSQFAVNLAFMLRVALGPRETPVVYAIEWLQWNAIAAGGYGLLWLGMRRWVLHFDDQTSANAALSRVTSRVLADIQLVVAAIAAMALVVWSFGIIFFNPASASLELASLGGPLSYIAIGLAAATALLDGYRQAARQAANIWPIAALALISLVAASCDQFDSGLRWMAYHVLLVGSVAVAALAAVASTLERPAANQDQPRDFGSFLTRLVPSHWMSFAIALLVTVMAIRGSLGDPEEPWWSVGAMMGVCLIFVVQGIIRRRQGYAYASLAAAPVAVFLFWLGWPTWLVSVPETFVIEASVLAVCGLSALWLSLEIQSQRRTDQPFDPRAFGPPAHHAGAIACVLIFALRLCFGTFVDAAEPISHPLGRFVLGDLWIIAALVALVALLARSLWDRRAFFVLPAAYVVGLLWMVNGLRHANLQLLELTLAATLCAAVYVAMTGHVWSYGANLADWGTRLGVSDTIGGLKRTSYWLPAISIGITAVVSLISLWGVLSHSQQEWRVAVALSPLIAAWGISCLAQQERKEAAQVGALLLAGLSAVYLGWAQLAPEWSDGLILERAFRLLMVLSALTFVYGFALPRYWFIEGSWNSAVRKSGYASGALAIITFVAVLGLEVAMFDPVKGAPVDGLQVAAVAVVLIALIAGLLSLALLPGKDPLAMEEKGRMFYVYGAQAVSGLLFAHLYVCRPMWFDSILRPYWPFIILGLAFAGIAAAELFKRQKIRVLSEPFRRTGGLLPLIPALAMLIVPTPHAPYELVLFLAGLMYLVLCVTQRSFLYGAAAALAGNAALWVLLEHRGIHFTDRPQLWLIPPAVAVLLAAQLNRTRLSSEQLTAARYCATLVIYLSSTSEIFIHNAATNLWPPIILAALSVAGALAGIVLRIRAFLYLGTSFTLMALVSMVWHAARAIDQTWPWWAFGIGTGIALLVLFALFEKKKEELKLLITRMRSWEQ